MAERDDTYSTLLLTSIRLFGRYGYDGVTTRMLAGDAGVNIAGIKYHFGSKDGLYFAAIDHIVAVLTPRVDIVVGLAAQAKTLAGDDPKRRALLLTQLVHTVLDTFLVNPAVREVIPFILREIFVPGPGFEHMYDAIPRRVHETFTELVAWILGLDSQSPTTIMRTHTVIGQLIVFHVGRAILTRRLGVDDYSEDDIGQIKQQATQSVLMSLGLPHD